MPALIQIALDHHQRGLLDEASRLYVELLQQEPRNFDALNLLGVLRAQQGRNQEGMALLKSALAIDPGNVGALLNLGPVLVSLGQLEEAVATYDQALALKPDFFEALFNRGVALAQLSRFEDAVASYDRALALQKNASCLYHRGICMESLGRLPEALTCYDRAIAAQPGYASAHDNRGNVLRQLGRAAEALESYDIATSLSPRDVRAWHNRGALLLEAARPQDALESCDRAVQENPGFAQAWAVRGAALLQLGRFDEALASLDKAIALRPQDAELLANRGYALWKMKKLAQALASYNHALQVRPDDVPTLLHHGQLLHTLNRHQDALADFDRAIALDGANAMAWNGRGAALEALKRHAEAISSFDRAITAEPGHTEALANRGLLRWRHAKDFDGACADLEQSLKSDPGQPYLEGELMLIRMYAAEWEGFESRRSHLEAGVCAGARVVRPFVFQALSESPADLQTCARLFADSLDLPVAIPHAPCASRSDRRIRIGYVSGEFREQATAYLMAGLYEHHDRSRFEVIAVDSGGGDASPMRKRLEAAFDRFIYIAGLSDDQAAELIRKEQIDILVNLNGYFGTPRMGVFARRPAPLQINYLGFPGTLGSACMDYIFADRVVIPPADARFYDESVVWLPNCYQVNDNRRPIATQSPSRAQAGLPDDAIVFCNFNQSYKFNPQTFQGWMRILARVENSVLWLLQGAAPLMDNLRRAAAAQGIAGSRLVFGPPLEMSQHLARLRLADLFLDSLPYNGHTTASDALWAGLPVLTRTGATFPARVAGSLLFAAGQPGLVTHSQEDFEARAVELASDPVALQALRQSLEKDRFTCPLFDTDLFRKNLEQAYLLIWNRWLQGQPAAGLMMDGTAAWTSKGE